MVVSFRDSAPNAHCAKVTVFAPACCSSVRTAGKAHRGACVANFGHQAAPSGSPQSAGFSTAQADPASSAARTRLAANLASVLYLAR
eukprot:3040715-Pleurochrysis_carterae.AAC.2